MLLNQGANVNAQRGCYGNTLQAAAYRGHVQVLRLLQEHGTRIRDSIDEFERNALHFAVRGGHLKVVMYLIDQGLDAKTKDGKGDTALHYAASGGSFESVKCVVQFYEFGRTNSISWSPLHWGARVGDAKILEALQVAGLRAYIIPHRISFW
jgi:ankyrin repeat protein